MTDNEIIKAMECVMGNDANCSECTYQKVLPFPSCRMMCAKNALGLINRQKAEIERLQKNIDGLNIFTKNHIKVIKSEAIKGFAEKLTNRICENVNRSLDNPNGNNYYPIDVYEDINNLVKEMTEESEK